jgi:hypothetical protein
VDVSVFAYLQDNCEVDSTKKSVAELAEADTTFNEDNDDYIRYWILSDIAVRAIYPLEDIEYID